MIKLQYKKFKGSAILVLTVVTATMIAAIALSLVKLNSAATSTVLMNKTQVQAQQYALAEASLVRAMRYTELSTNEYYRRINNTVEPISGSNFSKKVTIGSEMNFSGSSVIKQRTVNIQIYHNTDMSDPVINLDVPRYNREKDYMPVGAIVAWAGSGSPSDVNGKWLECNGSTISSDYGEVRNASVNVKTTKTPDFRGTYLAGAADTSEICTTLNAALPNIEGSITLNYVAKNTNVSVSGVFTAPSISVASISGSGGLSTESTKIVFNASNVSAIYGRAEDVRPKTTKIRYFIKAE
ncbi:MAG: tail fiber protein [Phascolarctobacterium sp.]|nr:tail fiber protein [Candidatus Phascolarctobacterium caballi]